MTPYEFAQSVLDSHPRLSRMTINADCQVTGWHVSGDVTGMTLFMNDDDTDMQLVIRMADESEPSGWKVSDIAEFTGHNSVANAVSYLTSGTTLADFRASRERMSTDDVNLKCPDIDGADLQVGQYHMIYLGSLIINEMDDGQYYLCIGNIENVTDDLPRLEEIVYGWGVTEGYMDGPISTLVASEITEERVLLYFHELTGHHALYHLDDDLADVPFHGLSATDRATVIKNNDTLWTNLKTGEIVWNVFASRPCESCGEGTFIDQPTCSECS